MSVNVTSGSSKSARVSRDWAAACELSARQDHDREWYGRSAFHRRSCPSGSRRVWCGALATETLVADAIGGRRSWVGCTQESRGEQQAIELAVNTAEIAYLTRRHDKLDRAGRNAAQEAAEKTEALERRASPCCGAPVRGLDRGNRVPLPRRAPGRTAQTKSGPSAMRSIMGNGPL